MFNDIKKINSATGKNIEIAIIDVGFEESDEIIYINSLKKKLWDNSYHGEKCAKIIYEYAKDVCLYKIDVMNDFGEIIEENIIEACKIAINMKVDIINISLGLKQSSFELLNVIKLAYDNNIIVCASASNNSIEDYIFPSSYAYALTVYSTNSIKNEWEIKDNKIYINQEKIFVMFNNRKIFLEGNSFATAYFSSICAKILEFNPLFVTESIFRLLKERSESQFNNCKVEYVVQKDNYYYVIDDGHIDLVEYKNEISQKYQGKYTGEKKCIVDVINATSDEKNIPVISSKSVEQKNYGIFLNLNNYQTKKVYSNDILNVDIPIISIVGFSEGMGKFELLVNIQKQVKEMGYNSISFSNNPLSLIFDYNYLNLLKGNDFLQNIGVMNRFLHNSSEEADLAIISLPGGIDYELNQRTFVSSLHYPFFNCHSIDIVVLCISQYIDAENIINTIEILETRYNSEVILFVSETGKELRGSTTNDEELNYYYSSKEEVEEYKSKINEILHGNMVVSMKEVKSGILSQNIIARLTND